MSAGSNWAQYYEYTAKYVHRPTTLDELQALVAGADHIRALGSRHSFNDLADSEQLVTLEGMPADIVIDEASETVSFSAGLRYGDLGTELERHGWALHNLASLPHISVAGAVATATHGSGDRNGILSRAVAGLELVGPTGDVLTITPADPDFDGAVVSLGALGVVSRITLDIEPTFQIRQDVYEGLEWTSLLDNYDAITARAYSVSVFTNWAGESVGTVWLKSRVDGPTPPQSLYGARPAHSELHPLPGIDARNTTAQLGVPGAWLDRLPHFKLGFTPSAGDELQTEYLVPRVHARAAITAMRSLGDRIAPHLHISELRTMSADSLWLSGAFETDAVGIHLTWKKEPEAVLALLPVIEEALEPFDARPHWGKLFHGVRKELYPRLSDFVELVQRFDPTGKFRNDYLERTVF
jgi:xylitol oxidase